MEIGEFVRTNKGIIDKVESYSLGCSVWHCKNGMCIDECNVTGVYLKDIAKHSKNIIDLIEARDYVNGKEINMNYETGKLKNIPKKIKTILTHEQYEQYCYRLEE